MLEETRKSSRWNWQTCLSYIMGEWDKHTSELQNNVQTHTHTQWFLCAGLIRADKHWQLACILWQLVKSDSFNSPILTSHSRQSHCICLSIYLFIRDYYFAQSFSKYIFCSYLHLEQESINTCIPYIISKPYLFNVFSSSSSFFLVVDSLLNVVHL